ncbi:MAG: hypothetical protein ABIG84_08690 [archaeon]
MADEKIYEYVRQNLQSGYSKDSIKQMIASQGYDAGIVDQVALSMRSEQSNRNTLKPLSINRYSLTDWIKTHLMLVEIILLVVVLAVAGYVFFVGV